MRTTCRRCGGVLTLSRKKLEPLVGGLAVVGVAALCGLSGGWLPLAAAAVGGSGLAANLFQAKCRMAGRSASGSTFVCSRCGHPATAAEVIGL